ncbi:hypothetical protein [Enterococcus gilvus]|uniref:hypothetical protein n=1 Tax=Enterococcus gilvus TaxID=160453 RepID=UPI0029131697|nr:hypothetical protein [Enterococcus gilvus]MDU5509448.1 hypothetical protein [Enterococcus gilvus]
MNNVPKIMVKSEGIAAIGSYAASLWSTRKIVLLSDKKSFDAEGAKVLQYLTIMGFDVQTLVLNEPLYTTAIANLVYQFLSDQKITKNDGIICLGNENLCQLSSLVATTYSQVIPLIQIPTTLIAQLTVCIKKRSSLSKLIENSSSSLSGILIDTALSNLSSKKELESAQSLLLRSGYSQDHFFRQELRKKKRIDNYQLNFKKLFL